MNMLTSHLDANHAQDNPSPSPHSRSQISPTARAFAYLALVLTLLAPTSAYAAFGLTDWGDVYTVESGAGLSVSLNKSSGDIKSIWINGIELQDQTKYSHIGSGLGSATVTGSVINGNIVKIEIDTNTLTHYIFVREGINNIYMATYISQQPSIGELRYIARLNSAALPNSPAESDLRNTVSTIESGDVFQESGPNGPTRSKYYGNSRAIDLTIKGATGPGVGIFIHFGKRERSSGGPFFRDIENQHGSQNEIYNYMNSGHNQTEAWRMGLHGPYAYIITDGSTPASTLDYSWMDSAGLGITGYVAASSRKNVTCSGISNRDPNFDYTAVLSNSSAQFWADASPTDGSFTVANVITGNYTMTVYKGELAVYNASVGVSGGGSTITVNPIAIDSDPSASAALWRIGDWDGTPNEFLNADKVTEMHPSDARLSSWDPGTYVVGFSNPATGMPCYQWKDIAGGAQAIQFDLAPEEIMDSTIRVGITAAYAGARPNLSVNSWTHANPSPSSQPNSRSITIGTYRGNNATYEFWVPASALVSGTNTLWVFPISGSGISGYLSAGYSLDCIDMTNPSVTDPPTGGGPTVNLATADYATGDGSVSGSYANTQASDNSYEQLTEGQSGGKPSNRYSTLDHTWTVNVVSGSSYSFEVEAHHTANSDSDDFTFHYSTDNGAYTPMLTVTKTADNNAVQTYALPASVAGTLYIRVTDTDSTKGNLGLDTLYVDYLAVVTSSSGNTPDTTPPAAPTNLAATAGDGSVSLNWTDNGEGNFSSYTVYRSVTSGSDYSALASDLASSSYIDNSTVNDTTYYYVITATDTSANESTVSNEASATPTGPGGLLQLAYDDFEAGIGNYTDGGGSCALYNGNRSPQGRGSMDIENGLGTASSFWTTNGIDVNGPGYTQLQIDFSFHALGMDTGDSFIVEYFDGASWHTLSTYATGIDFDNNAVYDVSLSIDEANYTFPANMKIRFQCIANNKNDDVYIDEIKISAL